MNIAGWEILAGAAVKATAVLLGACLAGLLARHAPAATRHLIWTAAISALLLLPLFTLTLPDWRAAAGAPATLLAAATAPAEPVPAAAVTPLPAGWNWRQIALLAWAAGALALLARLAFGLIRAAAIVRSAEPWLEDGVRRSERAKAPFVWGLFRPVILLPWEAAEWSPERLGVVLLHERAHIRRRDPLTHLAGEIARALYWFHPLAHYAARRMHLERERACDDCVIRRGADAAGYAGHLLALASAEAPAAVAMAAPSHLPARLQAILDTQRKRHPAGPAALALTAAAVIAIVAPLAALRAQGAFSVAGTVLDASGAVVPNARLALAAVEGTAREQTASKEAGEFSFPPLTPGVYQLVVEKPGFQRYLRIIRISNAPVRQNVVLRIGEISEEVVVTAQRTSNTAPPAGPHRIRVGGNVQAAKLERHTQPEYPKDARDRNVEGAVLLQAVILMDGSIGGLQVFSSPDPALSEAAMRAVREWRYQPTLLNGQPVEVITTVTVNFRLTP
jgi:TonB family protein